jgi:hypothetical protein
VLEPTFEEMHEKTLDNFKNYYSMLKFNMKVKKRGRLFLYQVIDILKFFFSFFEFLSS